jgi:hypothetical protein
MLPMVLQYYSYADVLQVYSGEILLCGRRPSSLFAIRYDTLWNGGTYTHFACSVLCHSSIHHYSQLYGLSLHEALQTQLPTPISILKKLSSLSFYT